MRVGVLRKDHVLLSFIQAAQRKATTYLVVNGLAKYINPFQHLKKQDGKKKPERPGGEGRDWWWEVGRKYLM